MIFFAIALAAIIVVVAIATYLYRRDRNHPARPHSHRAGAGRHAAPPESSESEPEDYYGDKDYGDGTEDDPRFMERPEGIATEPPEFLTAPVTAVKIPGYLTESVELDIPAYEAALRGEWPVPDRPTGIPIPEVSHGEWLPPTLPPKPEPRDRHVRPEDRILPPPLAPGLSALGFLIESLRPAAKAEAEVREREAEERRAVEEAELLRRNMEDFPHLFSPDIEYSDWDWKTDSGILNTRTLREQLAAEDAPADETPAVAA